MLKNTGVIVVRPSNTNWGDEGVQVDEAFPVDEEVDSIDTHVRSDKQRKPEEKMDIVLWKMNMMIVCVVCGVFGFVVGMYFARK
jgi:hypothetical protein